MKIVLNRRYGGLSLSDWVLLQLGFDPENLAWEDLPTRNDPKLVALVEADSEKASGEGALLKVIEIPDNYTDYELDEYDGAEGIIYVVDGKIYHA